MKDEEELYKVARAALLRRIAEAGTAVVLAVEMVQKAEADIGNYRKRLKDLDNMNGVHYDL